MEWERGAESVGSALQPSRWLGCFGRRRYVFLRGREWERYVGGLGITEQTHYRSRRELGGMKVSQARRLKRVVADLTLDKLILREALEGNY